MLIALFIANNVFGVHLKDVFGKKSKSKDVQPASNPLYSKPKY